MRNTIIIVVASVLILNYEKPLIKQYWEQHEWKDQQSTPDTRPRNKDLHVTISGLPKTTQQDTTTPSQEVKISDTKTSEQTVNKGCIRTKDECKCYNKTNQTINITETECLKYINENH